MAQVGPTTLSPQNLNPGYKERVRTGCLTCRASKVRCDEEKPRCRRCVRLDRTCVYKRRVAVLQPEAVFDHDHDLERGSVCTQIPGLSSIVSVADSSPRPETVLPATTTPSPNVLRDGLSVLQHHATSTALGHSNSNVQQLSPPNTEHSPSLLSMMVSQDIYLCTTIDLMGANEESARPTFAYFQRSVESPYITPYDPISWRQFKHCTVELAHQNALVAATVLAVESLYKAQRNGLSTTKALVLYRAAKAGLQTALEGGYEMAADHMLILGFLLHLGEMLLPEDTGEGPLSLQQGVLLDRLAKWSEQNYHTSLATRLASWLLICHAAARRGGNRGLLSGPAQSILRRACGSSDTLPALALDSNVLLHESMLHALSEPLYNFYFQLQLLSSQVADHSHYHRSRFTSEDQEEVALLITDLEVRMERLWDDRPVSMRCEPSEIRSQLSSQLSEPYLLQTAICIAAYNNEIVEVGRNLSDPPFASPEARKHMASIRALIECPAWPTTPDEHAVVYPAFLGPLFLYAIESIDEAETQWAVAEIRKIKDPISRSDFFAAYAEGLAKAQREKGRRVTTKWWCWQAFGVNPPYL